MGRTRNDIKREQASVCFQLDPKSGDLESGRFRGVASVFGSLVDSFPNRTRFRPGAFARTIAERANRIKILLQHNDRQIWIGVPLLLAESVRGLEVEASLNKTAGGQDAIAALKHLAEIDKLEAAELSIGFDVLNRTMVEEEDGELVRVVTEARLWEISLVNFGADPNTQVREVAGKKTEPESLSLDEILKLEPPDRAKALGEWLARNVEPEETAEGRVLSKKNRELIAQAIDALNKLLDAAEPPEEKEALTVMDEWEFEFHTNTMENNYGQREAAATGR